VIGKTVLQYSILSKIGGGGMGVVYKARDLKLDRNVALKFLPEGFVTDPQALERFQREARAVAALDHPSICTIHDIGEFEGQPYIVMQLLEGKTLRERIAERPMKVDEIIEFGIQIADGLEKAHSKGIIHRDIKPANVFITSDGHAKLLDFGLAKSSLQQNPELSALPTIGEDNLTNPGAIVGTFAYMSPEQAHGEELDARTDLFSFGALLYEMATGKPAFTGNTSVSVLDGILHKTPTPPVRLNPDVPAKLEEIIAKALEKNRENRSQSAAEIRADLRRLKRDTESAQSIALPAQKPSAVPGWVWVVVPAAVLTIALAVWGLRTIRNDTGPGSAGLSTNLRLTQFESSPGAFHPTISLDGKLLAFADEEQGQIDLFVRQTAGGGRVRVTNDAAAEWYPQFDPNGEKILFTRLAPGSDLPEICITPAFSGGVTPLISGGSNPAWSPKGNEFAFIRQRTGEPPSLAIADVSGQILRTILEVDATYVGFRDPAWSPDGSQIAIVRSMGGVSGEIWVLPASGGKPVRPWSDPPEVFSHRPVFNADGRSIVHSSNRGGATNLWTLFLDGTAPRRLTSGPGPDESPSVARNGTIAFSNSRNRWALLLVDTVLNQIRETLSHSSYLWAPVFSRDGQDIAVSRAEPDGAWHIWVVPTKGGMERRLTEGPTPQIYPRFSGDWVLYSSWSSGADRIWKTLRTGGVPVPLTPVRNEDDAYGDMSPDGKQLAFARTEGNITRVYVAPVEGGEARLLTQSPSTLPRWSPDGKWIAFSPDRGYYGGIFVVSADGSNERRLTPQGSWPVWWPDGRRIAYLAVGPDWNQQIRMVPVEGGPSTASGIAGLRFSGTNYPFDVSEKGLLTTTNTVHLSTEIWLATPEQ
jgi:serine/threonine protein kinase/Tol biopolymer transport system component